MTMNITDLTAFLEQNSLSKSAIQNLIKGVALSNDTIQVRKEKVSILENYLNNSVAAPEPLSVNIEGRSKDQRVAEKYLQLMKSAEKRGKEFSLTIADVRKLVSTKRCYYTGVELSQTDGDRFMTVDRIDNEKGYVKGNVVACTHWANQIKNQLFEVPNGIAIGRTEEFKALVNKVTDQFKMMEK